MNEDASKNHLYKDLAIGVGVGATILAGVGSVKGIGKLVERKAEKQLAKETEAQLIKDANYAKNSGGHGPGGIIGRTPDGKAAHLEADRKNLESIDIANANKSNTNKAENMNDVHSNYLDERYDANGKLLSEDEAKKVRIAEKDKRIAEIGDYNQANGIESKYNPDSEKQRLKAKEEVENWKTIEKWNKDNPNSKTSHNFLSPQEKENLIRENRLNSSASIPASVYSI